jgi:benzil reductase ((S)-benzoin forming)
MTPILSDRFALVTGSSSGIGRALAEELLQRGWEVAGIARRPATVAHRLYHHLRLDLSEVPVWHAQVRALLEDRIRPAERDRVGLVNNAAAAGQLAPVEDLDPIALHRLFGLNAVAPIGLMGLFARACRGVTRLRVLNVSTGAVAHALGGMAAYGSSKAALRQAGRVLAAEAEDRPWDLSVLSFEPGVVDTEMQQEARSRDPGDFPWVGLFRSFHEQGQLIAPATVAPAMADFLEADDRPLFDERRFGT